MVKTYSGEILINSPEIRYYAGTKLLLKALWLKGGIEYTFQKYRYRSLISDELDMYMAEICNHGLIGEEQDTLLLRS